MRNLSSLGLATALALAGCTSTKPATVASTAPAATATQTYPKGVGLDMADLDRTVNPCDDFYQFSGGNWLRSNPVPSYASRWGPRNLLGNRIQDQLRKILEDAAANRTAAPGSNAQKVGDFYAAAMDTVAIDRAGLAPLQPELNRVANIRSLANLRTELVHFQEVGTGAFFNLGVDVDEKNTTQYAVQLSQGGLTLPNREFYVKTDARTEKVKAAYRAYMQQVFELLGAAPVAAQLDAATVERIETRLAKASRTPVELRDPQANYNKLTVAAAQQRYPALDPKGLLAGLRLSRASEVIIGQPAFFDEVNAVLKTEHLPDLKVYLRWHLLRSVASALPAPYADAAFRYSQALSGAKQQTPRWKRIQAATDNYLGEAFGQLYVDQAFPPAAKAKALEMVNNIKASMAEHIQTNTWMSAPTKAEALKKLAALRVKIGYPDVWKDYSALPISRESYLKNLLAARLWESRREAAHLGQPIDRNEWGMTPPTINAYYNPPMNEIVFPAGYLQPPFFDPQADDAINYGAIGGVMGHEMTHGFDDQGRQYDAAGNLRDWWTPQDAAEFTKRAAVVGRQYNAFSPLDSVHVNGQLTMGENLADFAGLTVVYGALEKQLQQRYGNGPHPLYDGFTPEQRFFLSWAQLRRSNIRPEALRQQIATDPHSPDQYRTLGPLMNMPQFQQAFGCQEGSKMVRKAADRAVIW
ncbi:M13 family metallopeptidase [Hymenobacter convexus]|uniref:M13 family metallopeptidase n=1 Tax=Hymenobacter sp. CA1UV-4 TaxID=3063782 RepID=UPI00271324C9|nr:M13 family metallopeptidase [Hymenobacter sp. CA1UV-4]MDO7851204.1 M13 family metallopeptidase [Hymenobacter sp. CA1UV-4]